MRPDIAEPTSQSPACTSTELTEEWRSEKALSGIKAGERFYFLSGGGEMGRLIREFDWSCHRLGQPDDWPRSLKTAVSLILNSRHPMWIGWGPEMSFLYNDAYLD